MELPKNKACEFMQNNIISNIKQYIQTNKQKGNGTLCVLSPYSCIATEGYMLRVKAVDEFVLNPLCCVHLDFESGAKQPYTEIIDERHMVIYLVSHDKDSAKIALKIAKICKVLYIHSAIRCKENVIGTHALKLVKAKNVYKIWDVHGVLPEECVMQLNFLEAQHATKAEELLLENADCTLVISDAMVKHYEKKYGKKPNNPINTSVFTSQVENFDKIINYKPQNTPYNVVYAGNTMAWQNIPLMKKTIENCADKFNYKIFTHDSEDFNKQSSNTKMPNTLTVDSVPIEKVLSEYKNCHFGFALRDDTPVNNVATPTKIIEYIQFGIIPVFKSENIGDFIKLNLQFIDYKNLHALDMSFNEYKKMAKQNFEVLIKLDKIRQTGISMLKDVINKEL